MSKRKSALLCVFLCLTVLLSSLSIAIIGFNTFALDAYTVTRSDVDEAKASEFYQTLVTNNGTNLLLGKSAYARTSVWNDTVVAKNWTALTDGDASKNSILNQSTSWTNGTTLYDAGRNWYFELSETVDISKLTLFNYIFWGKDLEINNFAVYVSNSVSTLWSADSKVADYSVTANSASEEFNIIDITFNEKPQGKFVGIKWPHPCNFRTSNQGNAVILSEIALFGSKPEVKNYAITRTDVDEAKASEFYQTLVTNNGTNLLIGKSAYARTSVWNDTVVAKNWTALTDGDASKNSILNQSTSWTNGTTLYDAGRNWYFELSETVDISKLTLFNYIFWGKDLEINNFAVYVSNSVSTLWSADSKVADYSVTANSASEEFNIIDITFNEKPQGKFVGIKWPHPCNFRTSNQGNAVILSEIALFGSKPKTYTVTREDVDTSDITDEYSELVTNNGTNLLLGKSAYARTSVWNDTVVAKNWTALTDGDASKNSILNQSTSWTDGTTLYDAGRNWYFELSNITEIDRITLLNFIEWGKELELCDFEIYVSESAGMLWQSDTLVAEYKVNSNTATQEFNVINIVFNEKPKGKFVGIKWAHPCNFRTSNQNNSVILSEIALFGTEQQPEQKEEKAEHIELLDSLADGLLSYETGLNDLSYGKLLPDSASGSTYTGGMNQTTYNAYKALMSNNMLANVTPVVGTATGNKIIYKDGNYPFRATDGVINSASCYQISVSDGNDNRVNLENSPITITYDLGKTVMAESIMIGSSRGANQLVAYELYISDTEQDLYRTENKFASYDVANSVAVNRWGTYIEDTTKWANKPSSEGSPNLAQIFIPENAIGRYFGIKVIRQCTAVGNNADQIAIGEFAFYARPFIVTESNKTAKDSKEIYDRKNILKKATAGQNGFSFNLSKLADGDYATVINDTVNEGTVYFELDDAYMIDGFVAISGAGNARLGAYEVFASLDIDELFLEENKKAYHTAVAQDSPDNEGCTVDSISFNEPFKAKYIGIKVKEASLLTVNGELCLYELVATGGELPAYTVNTQVLPKTEATKMVATNYGVNRLLKGTIEAKNVHKGFGYNQAYLIDDDLTEFYFERDGGNPQITITMRSEIMVSDFAIFSAANPYGLGGIRLGEYELYISEDKDKLYNSENLAAHVVPTKHSTMDNATVVDFISLKDAKKARYFGIRILDDNLSDTYVGIRVQEFAVYGSPLSASHDKMTALMNSLENGLLDTTGKNDLGLGKAVATPDDQVAYNGGLNKPTYDAINELYYNKNLLSGKIADISVDDGYTIYSPDGSVERLTDGVISSASTYSLQVKDDNGIVNFDKSNIYLTYDLGKKKSLELLTIAGYSADNYQQQKYKIYASNDLDSLYKAENLVTVYDISKNKLANGNPLPTDPYAKNADSATNSKPLIAQYIDMSGISASYVGIRILGDKDRVALGEISLWASKDTYLPQLDKYGLYSEEIFNLIENGDLEKKPTAEDWGEFNRGFKRVNNSADAATHGSYYLVTSDNGVQTWKFTVKPETEYTVAFSAKLNGESKVKFAVAYNEQGNQFEDIIDGSISGDVEKGVITIGNTNNQWKRFGYSFYSAEYTEVYITVENINGSGDLDDFYLFRSDRNYSSDPNDYNITSPAYVGNVEVVDLDNLPVEDDSDFDEDSDLTSEEDSGFDEDSDLTLEDDISGDDNKESNSDLESSDSEKGNNGNTIWLIIIIASVVVVFTVAVILILKRRGGKSK